jgi:hypothetical protein
MIDIYIYIQLFFLKKTTTGGNTQSVEYWESVIIILGGQGKLGYFARKHNN